MTYTRWHTTWVNLPSQTTSANAGFLQHVEDTLFSQDGRITLLEAGGGTGGTGTVTSVTAADTTITIAGTSVAPTVAVNTIPESKVTNLTTDLATKIPYSFYTAPGDLVTYDSSLVAPHKIPVSTDGTVLTADSFNSSGFSWQLPPVRSVAGRTGLVVLTKADVALGNVDNTSDVNKPVSTAQAAANVAIKKNVQSQGVLQTYRSVIDFIGPGVSFSDNAGSDRSEFTFPANVVGLTDAATIATPADQSCVFRVTLGGNRTLGNPTGMVDGQIITWELIQDATGSRTITLDTVFRATGTVSLSTTALLRDFLRAIYNSTTNKFYVLQLLKGF